MRHAAMLLFCITLGCVPPPAAPPEPKPDARYDTSPLVDNVIDYHYFISERAQLESYWCMLGQVDTVHHIQMLMPIWVVAADSGHVQGIPSLSCPTRLTLGAVHFHPPGAEACGLSEADIEQAHELSYPISAVVCRERRGDPPRLIVVGRAEIEERYAKLPRDLGGKVSTTIWSSFTPAYHYRQFKRKP